MTRFLSTWLDMTINLATNAYWPFELIISDSLEWMSKRARFVCVAQTHSRLIIDVINEFTPSDKKKKQTLAVPMCTGICASHLSVLAAYWHPFIVKLLCRSGSRWVVGWHGGNSWVLPVAGDFSLALISVPVSSVWCGFLESNAVYIIKRMLRYQHAVHWYTVVQ